MLDVSIKGLKILAIDDEKSIRKFLKTSLAAEGCQVSEAATAEEAFTNIVSFKPDVVLLDLGLPDKDGIDVTEQLRKITASPIIILSIRDSESDKIKALDAGADDYLTKPFSMDELLARIRAVMRRMLKSEIGQFFETGNLKIDFTKRQVLSKQKPVHLSPTEYDMLKLFILNAGIVLSHRKILQEIWGKNEDFEGAGHLLRVTISNLRNKIEPNPERPSYILTEPAIGYRFCVLP